MLVIQRFTASGIRDRAIYREPLKNKNLQLFSIIKKYITNLQVCTGGATASGGEASAAPSLRAVSDFGAVYGIPIDGGGGWGTSQKLNVIRSRLVLEHVAHGVESHRVAVQTAHIGCTGRSISGHDPKTHAHQTLGEEKEGSIPEGARSPMPSSSLIPLLWYSSEGDPKRRDPLGIRWG